LLKDVLFPRIQALKSVLDLSTFMLRHITVNTGLILEEKYIYLFSVEEVNRLVLQGVPFRDAYKQVGRDIETGKYKPDYNIHHTHEGSIGNPCTLEIRAKMEGVLYGFDFDAVKESLEKLLLPLSE
jgi:argininosuccinate lyase